MKTELDVLEALRETIMNGVGKYSAGDNSLSTLTDKSVVIDYPEPEGMNTDTVFFITPDYENFSSLTLGSDSAEFSTKVTIMCKGAKYSTLLRRVFLAFNALYLLLRQNQTLSGFVDSITLESMDYYPTVTESKGVVAIETSLTVMWDKQF